VPDAPTLVKCLVWDLDNTLWRGTLLEGAQVEIPEAVRQVVTTLDSRGVLQSIASKNDHDLAWARLEELGMADYFVVPRIGWGPKSESVRAIAERLNFAHTTIAFVDDDPAERAEVTFHEPDIRCYGAQQVLGLTSLPEFSPRTVTVDSARRRQMYQANFRREAAQADFQGPAEEFLRTLGIVMEITRAGQQELARLEELTLRTSQMNATGVHYSRETLGRLLADPAHEVLAITLADRFGPHGAVGIVLLETRPRVWHLKLLATSCRVVSYGVGTVILNWLADQTARVGAHLAADFHATGRNRIMEVAYRFAGLGDQPCACLADLGRPEDGTQIQRLHLEPEPRALPQTMQVIAPELLGDPNRHLKGAIR
jgi:methoxymalonate biosynthesis protein